MQMTRIAALSITAILSLAFAFLNQVAKLVQPEHLFDTIDLIRSAALYFGAGWFVAVVVRWLGGAPRIQDFAMVGIVTMTIAVLFMLTTCGLVGQET